MIFDWPVLVCVTQSAADDRNREREPLLPTGCLDARLLLTTAGNDCQRLKIVTSFKTKERHKDFFHWFPADAVTQ